VLLATWTPPLQIGLLLKLRLRRGGRRCCVRVTQTGHWQDQHVHLRRRRAGKFWRRHDPLGNRPQHELRRGGGHGNRLTDFLLGKDQQLRFDIARVGPVAASNPLGASKTDSWVCDDAAAGRQIKTEEI